MKRCVLQSRVLCAALVSLVSAVSLMAQLPVPKVPIAGMNAAGNQINVTTSGSIFQWQSFNIGAGNSFTFQMPNASAAILNQVVGIGGLIPASVINGSLNSIVSGTGARGGSVYFYDPSGILLGPKGSINVGEFIGSTLGVSDENWDKYINGHSLSLQFQGSSAQGSSQGISLAAGASIQAGDVFLFAHSINNDGQISGNHVGLGAGSVVELQSAGLQRVSVLAGASDASSRSTAPIQNGSKGVIQATVAELDAAGGNMYGLAINNGGAVRATTLVNEGGQIYLRGDGGGVLNSGTLDASGTAAGAKGGTVEVTGTSVSLASGSMVDVSGEAGGGTALIGGGAHGADSSVPDAAETTVAQSATIDASAGTSGNGGKVVVWGDSDGFAGSITARGGSMGGNGGSVEVSGHGLDFTGLVNTLAPNGKSGDLLLDPTDLTINNTANSSGTTVVNGTITPTGATSTLTWNTIINNLGGGPVTVTTVGSTGSGPNNGEIVVAASPSGASSLLNANNASLTLQAAGELIVNAPITTFPGTGGFSLKNLTLESGAGKVSGSIDTDINDPITVSGTLTVSSFGNISIGANAGLTATGVELGLPPTIPPTIVPSIVSLQAATGGTGTLSFGSGVTVAANSQFYQAGIGSKTTTTSASANLVNNDPIFVGSSGSSAPANFTYEQDASISDANIPLAAQFTKGLPTTGYTIQSDGGSVTLDTTGADVAGTALTLVANTTSGIITIGEDLTSKGNPLASLTATAPSIDITGPGVSTGTGAQTYSGAVTLPGSGTVTLTGSGITFDKAVTSTGASLDVADSGTTVVDGNVSTGAGAQTYGGAVTLPGTGTVTLSGTDITFDKAVTSTGASLDVADSGTTQLGANVSTGAGAQTYAGAVNLNANLTLTGSTIDFASSVTGGNNSLTLDNSGLATLNGTVSGVNVLTASGTTGTLLADNTISATSVSDSEPTTLSGGSVTTTGDQNYNGETITLTKTTTLTSGTLELGAVSGGNNGLTLDNSAPASSSGTITAGTLTLEGAGAVSSLNTAITTLSLDKTAGDSTLNNGAAALDVAGSTGTGGLTLTAGATTFGTTSVGGNLGVTASGTVSQTGALTVTGTTTLNTAANAVTLNNSGNTFGGVVDVTQAGSVALTDGNASGLSVTGTSSSLTAQALNGPMTIGYDATGTVNGSASGNIVVGSDITGSSVSLQAATTGTGTLTFDAGVIVAANTQFYGAGSGSGTTASANLVNNGPVFVSTSGSAAPANFTYEQDASISDSGIPLAAQFTKGLPTTGYTIQSDGGSVTLNSTGADVAGTALTLSANAAGGTITIGEDLTGTGNPLASLTATSPSINITGPGVTTTGAQTYTGGVTGATATVLTGTTLNLDGAGAVGSSGTLLGASFNSIVLSKPSGDSFISQNTATPVNVSGNTSGSLTLTAGATTIGTTSVGGSLGVTTTGPVGESGAVTVDQTTSVNAGANSINLGNFANDFAGAVTVTTSGTGNGANINNGANELTVGTGAGSVSGNLTTSAAATVLSASTVGGTLGVTATGPVSETGVVAVSGTSSVSAGANSINLGSSANDFGGPVTVNNTGANDVALVNNAPLTVIASVGQDLSATALNGAALTVSGGVGGSASLTGGATTLGLTSFGALGVTASGPVSQTGVVTVTGTSSVSAGANSINLGSSANDFGGPVTVTTTGTGNGANINNGANELTVGTGAGSLSGNLTTSAAATVLSASTVGGTLGVTATGPVSETGVVTVTGTSSVSAGANSINLGSSANDFGGPVTVNNTGAADVTLNNGNNALTVGSGSAVGGDATLSAGATTLGTTALGTILVGRTLAVAANGAVGQTGALTVGQTTSVSAGANSINLGNSANDFGGAVTVHTTGAANDVTLNNGNNALTVGSGSGVGGNATLSAGATTLGTTGVGGNLGVTADGAVSQTAGTALTVTGTTSVNAGANAITLANNGNDLGGAVTVDNIGANNVALNNGANALTVNGTVGGNLGTTTTTGTGTTTFGATSAGSLTAISGGAVGQTAGTALTVAGTTSVNAGANAITLANNGNDFVGTVTVNNTGAANAVGLALNNGNNLLTLGGSIEGVANLTAGTATFTGLTLNTIGANSELSVATLTGDVSLNTVTVNAGVFNIKTSGTLQSDINVFGPGVVELNGNPIANLGEIAVQKALYTSSITIEVPEQLEIQGTATSTGIFGVTVRAGEVPYTNAVTHPVKGPIIVLPPRGTDRAGDAPSNRTVKRVANILPPAVASQNGGAPSANALKTVIPLQPGGVTSQDAGVAVKQSTNLLSGL
jgi:filamentous hemagglutinin family protein